jgi:phospholipase C
MIGNRRRFLQGVMGAGGVAFLSPKIELSNPPQTASASLPEPASSGIERIVVVTMENRSFDHLLGWLPGADGQQAGLRYEDLQGNSHSTYSLAPNFTGCPQPVDNSYQGGRVEWDDGSMDGWLKLSTSSLLAIGYYVAENQPFLSALAENYTTLDHYFCSILAPTFPNRLFLYAAQTDRLSDTISFTSLPTILDQLAAAGVSARYYFSNLPFVALWGLKYLPIARTYSDFLHDAASGHLPAVSFLDPAFTLLDDGTGVDDHPHTDIRRGDAFLADTFHAVASGPGWAQTVFIVTFDEWGGFFDHVAPPRAIAPNSVDPDLIDGQALLGARIPAIIASPWTRGNPEIPTVNSTTFDHTSILKLIEWRWSLNPLTARDASNQIGNVATALNFSSPNTELPSLPLPAKPSPVPCWQTLFSGELSETTRQQGRTEPANEWSALAGSKLVEGWQGKIREATRQQQ